MTTCRPSPAYVLFVEPFSSSVRALGGAAEVKRMPIQNRDLSPITFGHRAARSTTRQIGQNRFTNCALDANS